MSLSVLGGLSLLAAAYFFFLYIFILSMSRIKRIEAKGCGTVRELKKRL